MLRRLLFLVSAVVLVDIAFYSAITPLLPFYTDELDLSKSEAGALAGAYAAGTLLAALPAGFLAARWGPRQTLLCGLGLLAFACVVFGFAEQYELLVGARFVQGVGGAGSWAAGMSWLIAATPPERRGEIIGAALGVAIAGALAGPVLGALAEATSTSLVFSTVAAFAALLAAGVVATPAAAAGARGRVAAGRGGQRACAGRCLADEPPGLLLRRGHRPRVAPAPRPRRERGRGRRRVPRLRGRGGEPQPAGRAAVGPAGAPPPHPRRPRRDGDRLVRRACRGRGGVAARGGDRRRARARRGDVGPRWR